MPQAHWTPQAERDLAEIVYDIGIEQNRRDTARKIAVEFHEKCDLHATIPLGGTARNDLGENYRVFSLKRWVVVFRPHLEEIEVMRIFDGSRDYPRLFH